ncbi:MAG: type II secretion system F family protein [Deltaproteobacteria bacterium]|nr:type II secretion system F family protein [Deltaproteobacteria bacterium]
MHAAPHDVAWLIATLLVALITAGVVVQTALRWLRLPRRSPRAAGAETLATLTRLPDRAGDKGGAEDLDRALAYAGLVPDAGRSTLRRIRYGTLGVAAILAAIAWATDPASSLPALFAIAGLIGAAFAPQAWLQLRVKERQRLIGRSLPAAIDLVYLGIEAGLGLEQSFERTAKEFQLVEPELAAELSLMVREVAAGLTFVQAIKRMAERVGLDELTVLASLIAQATTLGASISQTFREYVESSRNRRMAALEERAGKVSAALTLPLVLCLLPAALLAVVGPAIVMISISMRSW